MLSYAQCLSQSPQQKRKFLTSPWTVASFLYMNSVTQAAHTGLSEKLFIRCCSKGSCRSVTPELHCGLSCQSDPPQSEWIIFLVQDWHATEATTRLWWRSQCIGGKSQIKGGWRKRDWVAWKNKKKLYSWTLVGGWGCFHSMCLTCPGTQTLLWWAQGSEQRVVAMPQHSPENAHHSCGTVIYSALI